MALFVERNKELWKLLDVLHWLVAAMQRIVDVLGSADDDDLTSIADVVDRRFADCRLNLYYVSCGLCLVWLVCDRVAAQHLLVNECATSASLEQIPPSLAASMRSGHAAALVHDTFDPTRPFVPVPVATRSPIWLFLTSLLPFWPQPNVAAANQ